MEASEIQMVPQWWLSWSMAMVSDSSFVVLCCVVSLDSLVWPMDDFLLLLFIRKECHSVELCYHSFPVGEKVKRLTYACWSGVV